MTDTRRSALALQARRVAAFTSAIRQEGLHRDHSLRNEWRKVLAVALLVVFAMETLFFVPLAGWIMELVPPGIIAFFVLLAQWTLMSPAVLVLWNAEPAGRAVREELVVREARRRELWEATDTRVRDEIAAERDPEQATPSKAEDDRVEDSP